MSINIVIGSPNSTEINITVKLNDTIGDAKKLYVDNGGDQKNNQWIFNAKVLKNEETIKNLKISDLDVIEAHPSYRGGYLNII